MEQKGKEEREVVLILLDFYFTNGGTKGVDLIAIHGLGDTSGSMETSLPVTVWYGFSFSFSFSHIIVSFVAVGLNLDLVGGSQLIFIILVPATQSMKKNNIHALCMYYYYSSDNERKPGIYSHFFSTTHSLLDDIERRLYIYVI